MQKIIRRGCVLISVLLFGSFFFHLSLTYRSGSELAKGYKASIGTEDDPEARLRYEWMRLRDPKTNEIPRDIRAKELAFAKTLPTKETLVLSQSGQSEKVARDQILTWAARGPNNVGGRTRALAVDVSNENVMLAGGVSGGMWRSTNGGSSWTRTTVLSTINQSVTCIAQDTRNLKTSTWYYGTGEYAGGSASGGGSNSFYSGDGIYKSTDGGITWNILSLTSTGKPQTFDNFFDYIWNIAIDPSNTSQDEVYAATYGAVWRSTNGGQNWSAVRGVASPYSDYVDVAVTSTGVVYATLSSGGTQQGIWRSTDGVTWANLTPAGWPATYRRVVIGIAPSNQNVVYFLADTPGSGTNNHSLWKYTFLSGDGSGAGGSWVDRSANMPAFGDPVGNFDSQKSYDLISRVKTDNENVVFIGGTNLYRSTDGFATISNTTWIGGYATANNISQYADHHPDQHSFAFLPSNPSVAFSGHDGGISKTSNILASSVVWNSLNSGYLTTQFYTVAIDHGTNGNNIIVGGMQDNGTWFTNSTNSTTNWVEIGSGDGAYCAIADGRTFYVYSVQNGKAYRSTLNDNGVESQWARIDPTGASGYIFINPFALDPNDNKLMYVAAGDRLWRNSDITAIQAFSNNTTSVNWTELTNSAISGSVISALGISKSSANRLFYGTKDGKVYRLDGANTGNPTPTDVWTGKGLPSSAYVSCIAVDPTDANKAIVVFSNYSVVSLFYTTNGGTSWTAVSGNLEQNPDGTGNGPSCRWVTIVPIGGTTNYFVGTSTGLYSTTSLNGSSTIWAQEGSTTIGNVVVDMLDYRTSDGLVVAATHANGVFSANISIPLTAPTLVSPADGATGVSTNPMLTWNAVSGATSYAVQVATSSGFSTLVVNQSGITSTTYNASGLSNNTTYFWRVSATNAGGTGPSSSTRSFTTIVAAPTAPTLVAPADGAAGVTVNPTFVWSAVAGADSYSLQVSVSSGFGSFVVNQSGITGTSFVASGLSTNTQYFWRVSATNVGGTSPFSITRSFTTAPPSSVELIDAAVPREFNLAQNYPNPFNPSTIIRFSIPREVPMRLTVLDAQGKTVAQLVNETRSAGTYEVRWDGKDSFGRTVATGVYFYRLETPGYQNTKRMLLVK